MATLMHASVTGTGLKNHWLNVAPPKHNESKLGFSTFCTNAMLSLFDKFGIKRIGKKIQKVFSHSSAQKLNDPVERAVLLASTTMLMDAKLAERQHQYIALLTRIKHSKDLSPLEAAVKSLTILNHLDPVNDEVKIQAIQMQVAKDWAHLLSE